MKLFVYPPVPTVSITVPPIEFIKDGASTQVVKDTTTPANTVGLPVEIVAANGTEINITAGDINVQTSHTGSNPDSMRVGDGTTEWGIEAVTKKGLVKDELVETAVNNNGVLIGPVTETAPTTDIASSGLNGRLQRVAQNITSLISKLPSLIGRRTSADSLSVTLSSDHAALPLPTGAATESTLSALNTKVMTFDADTGAGTQTLPGFLLRKSAAGGSVELGTATDPMRVDPTGTTTQPVSAVSLPLPAGASTEAKQDAEAVLIGPVTETAPTTDIASSGLNGRLQRIAQRLTSLIALLPSSIGQKTGAGSLSVVVASDQASLPVTQGALVASYQQNDTVAGTAQTITAPAGAKWCKVMNLGAENLRIRMDGTAATATSGLRLEAGRSEDFSAVGNISVIAETGTGQSIGVQFGA